MSHIKFLLLAGVFLFFSQISHAQDNGVWEKAYARPHGAILVEEIDYDPQKFLIQNQGKQVRIAGNYLETNTSRNGLYAASMIVWGNNFKGVSCNTRNKDEISKAIDLQNGIEVIVSGNVDRLSSNGIHLSSCTITEGVTLFHDRDQKFILGNWCMVLNGKTFRKEVFSRGENGEYLQQNYDLQNGAAWRKWSWQDTIQVKRSPREIVTAKIDPKGGTYLRQKYFIKSHNQMYQSDGSQFYRCK